MKFDEALAWAIAGALIGRADWPVSRAVTITFDVKIGRAVHAAGAAIHPLQDGSPRYAPTSSDIEASDWMVIK